MAFCLGGVGGSSLCEGVDFLGSVVSLVSNIRVKLLTVVLVESAAPKPLAASDLRIRFRFAIGRVVLIEQNG